MADGTPMGKDGKVTQELRNIKIIIGTHTEKRSIDIVDMQYDMVLGMDWLQQHNPNVDWIKGILEFPKCNHGTQGARSAPRIPTARTVWVRPMVRAVASASEQALPPEYKDFEDLFREREGIAALPQHKPWDHEIPIEDGKTPNHYQGLIPLSKKEEDFLKEYIDKHLQKGFIRPSKSSIAHGVLFAPKKDGSLRPCIDYRKLNAITKKNRYPLPRIDELQDRLIGAKWFTAIDIRDAYYRIRMKEGEEWKTAFRTRWGLYEYLVMPFGLTNAPASFQELINDTLREYLDNFVSAYLDDIVVFSKTYDEHVGHVRKVLQKLKERDLPVKLSKCEFHQHKIQFLGYVVSTEGIGPDPKKIESVNDWPEPTTVKEVQALLGFFNYYRKFVEGFSKVAAPISNLTKKLTSFVFDDKCRQAFKELKRRLTTAPVLALFDPDRQALLETDASDFAIGACLAQKGADGRRRPIAYYSRKMTGPELNYDIHDKELLAIVEAFREWRVYLEGTTTPVQVYTDHKNLLYWTTTKVLNRRQVRWSETLASCNFQIYHVKGSENGGADALSRRPDYSKNMTITEASMLKQQDGALVYKHPKVEQLCTLTQELTQEQKQEIIRAHHDDLTAGHGGIDKTIELITRNYLWQGLRNDVKNYIAACDTCHKSKHARHKPYGLLQPLPPPDKPWQSVTMDFIGPLPLSEEPLTGAKYDSILVLVDRFTKYCYFVPHKTTSTAEDMAFAFLRTIVSRHGVPQTLITDRDKLFTSQFWQSFVDLLGVEHKLSTSFHPQTDGQTERANQVLEQYLRCYLNYEQDSWATLLPLAELAVNNRKSANGVSPFYANYGIHPDLHHDTLGTKPISEDANILVTDIKKLHDQLHQDMIFISERMAKFANRKRIAGPILREGEKVYLLSKNIKTKRPSKKLDHTKLGPFRILEKKNENIYKLDLPKHMRIHPVFHISLLEKAPQNAVPGPIELDEETQEPRYEIERVLRHKIMNGKRHYLIHWKGHQYSEATWEPEDHLTSQAIQDYQEENPSQANRPFGPSQPTKQRGRPRKRPTTQQKK
ncbi:Transposon Tf2-5 polyprotein-like protein 2 [Elsinoe fawcettii]|nr:Transposon Tf2-5 polyprotein-like protein 2 [Elsinoe fawcettii]